MIERPYISYQKINQEDEINENTPQTLRTMPTKQVSYVPVPL
ncbi:hypothetical protein PPHE_a1971 [Pseudoalteromonas phenolica O-BC30]|nr:hypothetical protein [Pseudoalteromonas phenolica O-BC30]